MQVSAPLSSETQTHIRDHVVDCRHRDVPEPHQTCFVAFTRAREAQTEPHLPPLRRRPLSPISLIPDPGSGRTLEPPLVRSAAMVTAPVELS
jgi:hypothetical protein